ncbi:MAG: hypothetical protein ACRDBM_08300 [Sporomusa sp.]
MPIIISTTAAGDHNGYSTLAFGNADNFAGPLGTTIDLTGQDNMAFFFAPSKTIHSIGYVLSVLTSTASSNTVFALESQLYVNNSTVDNIFTPVAGTLSSTTTVLLSGLIAAHSTLNLNVTLPVLSRVLFVVSVRVLSGTVGAFQISGNISAGITVV